MLKFVQNELDKRGLLTPSTPEESDGLNDALLVEAAHVLDELSEVSVGGNIDPDITRNPTNIIPLAEEVDDPEIDNIEFCLKSGVINDIPGDAATTLQEAFYDKLLTRNDFYNEACSSITQMPRESDSAFMDRIEDKCTSLYNEYMNHVYQEGLFDFGKISLDDPSIRWNIHINFGKLRTNGDGDYVKTLPVLYQAPNNKIIKKQLESVKYFDYIKISNAREIAENYMKEKNLKMPKDGNIWDIIAPESCLVPIEPKDQMIVVIEYKCVETGESVYFSLERPIKEARSRMKNMSNKESIDFDNNGSESVSMKSAKKIESNLIGKQEAKTITEYYNSLRMPSRWDNGYVQEAIDFGGQSDPPEYNGGQPAAPTNDNPPAPGGDAEPPAPTESNNADGSADIPDDNAPADPPAPEQPEQNPNTNDISADIAAKVNENLESQAADDSTPDLSVPDEEPNFDTAPMDNGNAEIPTDMDNNTDPTTTDVEGDADSEIGDESELPDEGVPEDMDQMSINQLIEQAKEKVQDMPIEKLKEFLSNTDDEVTDIPTDADQVTESFKFTKSNINGTIDVLLRTALGILNDDKLSLSEIITKFKKNGKKLNKALGKASKATEVYNESERKHISELNRCLVDLLSVMRVDYSQQTTLTIKKLIKVFVSKAQVVGEIVENHKKAKPVQEGAFTALFNIREKVERAMKFAHNEVTGPIKEKADSDKLTAAWIKSAFKSTTVSTGYGAGGYGDGGYGGATVTSTVEEVHGSMGRLTKLKHLHDVINSKERKQAKFTADELKTLESAGKLSKDLYDDIQAILRANEEESSKLLADIKKEAVELDKLCTESIIKKHK